MALLPDDGFGTYVTYSVHHKMQVCKHTREKRIGWETPMLQTPVIIFHHLFQTAATLTFEARPFVRFVGFPWGAFATRPAAAGLFQQHGWRKSLKRHWMMFESVNGRVLHAGRCVPFQGTKQHCADSFLLPLILMLMTHSGFLLCRPGRSAYFAFLFCFPWPGLGQLMSSAPCGSTWKRQQEFQLWRVKFQSSAGLQRRWFAKKLRLVLKQRVVTSDYQVW